jgi:hypothetical protein
MSIYKNAGLYIADAYSKINTLGVLIMNNYSSGYGNSVNQRQLWNQTISLTKQLRNILRYSAFDGSGNFTGTYRITDQQFNQLLSRLIRTGDLMANPSAPKLLFQGMPSYLIGGTQGPQGDAGQSSYLYVGYAQDSGGNGFSTTPDSTRPYIAFKNSTIPLTVVSAIFSGLWQKYFGDPGAAGANGTNGISSYIHVAWADSSDGTGFTLTFDSSKKYVAFLVNNSSSTPVQGDFAGLWAKYLGDNGTNGTNGATIYSGSGAPNNALGANGDFYIDLSGGRTFYGPKSAGAWGSGFSLQGVKGDTGDTGAAGTNGTNGTNGANAFLYVAYADDALGAGFTTTFDGSKTWIAFLNTNTLIAYPAQSDFTGLWAKYRGDGDRWTTTTSTTLTISIAIITMIVDKNLAWSTGQRAVVAVPYDPSHRMEGVCQGYNPTTGQLTISVDTIYGTGSFPTWDISLMNGASVRPIEKTVSTSGGTITLDFSGNPDVIFVGSANIGGNKTIAISNDSIAVEMKFLFTISGGLYDLTFPSKFIMSDVRWEVGGAKKWSPVDQGKYKASATYHSVNDQWEMDITGPYQ